jgi:flavin-dependent dehydrogenase
VSGLLRDGNRVTGVEVGRNGKLERITARIVVGADGRNSTVARLAGAEEYFGYDNTRGGYWAYWPAPAIWRTASPYSDFDFYLGFDREDLRFIFHTDGDLLLIGTTPPVERMRTWSRNFEASYLNDLAQNPITGPLVENSKPVGRILGLKKGRFGFKSAVGPGWALVGDAGLHKDPTPGNGITDALRDARSLADAIIDGSERALARYWRKRDVDSFELFRQAEDMGTPGFVNPLNSLIWKNMNDPEVAHRLSLSMDRRISPYGVISVSKMLKWMTKAVVRGNFEVVKPFLDAGKRGGEIRREFDARKKMLEAVS